MTNDQEVEHTQLQSEIGRLRADNHIQCETIEAVYDALGIEPQMRSVERILGRIRWLKKDHNAMEAFRSGQVASIENYRGVFTAKGGKTKGQVVSTDPVKAILGIMNTIKELEGKP